MNKQLTLEDYQKLKLLAQARAQQEFYPYRQYLNPGMKVAWFTYELARGLQQFYDDFVVGKRPVLIINTPPQFGKQVADETPVLTTKGWKTHGELKVGDFVWHPCGKPVKVLAVSGKTPAKMRVEFNNGEVIWCHELHEWPVGKKAWGKKHHWRVVETQWLACQKLINGVIGKRGSSRTFHLPNIQPLMGLPQKLPIAPYALGVWLGNGNRDSATITQGLGDVEPICALEELGYKAVRVEEQGSSSVRYCYNRAELYFGLKELGFMQRGCAKFIPEIYLLAPLKDRLELLAGLIDTDGTSMAVDGRASFTTTDKELMETFCQLVATFGWRTRLQIEQPSLSSGGIQGKKVYYQIGFNPTLHIPCRIPRKQFEPKPYSKTRAGSYRTAIHSIQRFENSTKSGHCVTVDAPDGLYCVGRRLLPTHNSTTVLDFVSWVVGHNPDLKVIYTSYSDDLCKTANGILQRILYSEKYQELFPELQLGGPGSGYRRDQSTLEFVAHRGSFHATTIGGQITGKSLDLGVIDDPLKGRAEANSEVERNRVWNWLTDDMSSRFSEHAGLLVIGTRWHIDDPLGRLLEHYNNYTDRPVRVLKFPAIATRDEKYRRAGDPLFPEHKSLEFLIHQEHLLSRSSWEALYQQSPIIIGGGLFPIEKFRTAKVIERDKIVASVRSIDKAISTSDTAAWTAMVLMHRMRDGTFLVEHVDRGRWSLSEREARIRYLAETDRQFCKNYTIVLEMEPGSGGKESAEATVRNLAGFKVYVDRVVGKGSKEIRAEPYATQVQNNNVFLVAGDWNYTYIDECGSFPFGKYKDQVDASSAAFNYLVLSNKVIDPTLAWVG